MTGDIQPTKKALYAPQGTVMTFNCAIDSTLVKGQEVVISAAGLVEARSAAISDNFIGVVDSLPKDGRVGVRTIFLCEIFATFLGTLPNGTGVIPRGGLVNNIPFYDRADSGDHYAAIILDNSNPTNTRLGILYTPRLLTSSF